MHAFLPFIERFGALAVLLLVTAEGFGVPLPGETALVTAAAIAARGQLGIEWVLLASWLGTVLGGTGGYWIGRSGGAALLTRHGRLFRLDEARLRQANEFFARHGAKTVFLARFVALLRVLAGILAGAARMSFGRFSLYNAAGGLCWTLVFGMLGYVFGRNLHALERNLGRASLALLVLVLVGGGVWWWRRRARAAGAAASA